MNISGLWLEGLQLNGNETTPASGSSDSCCVRLPQLCQSPVPTHTKHTEGDFIMCSYIQSKIEGSTKVADIAAKTIWIQLHLCIEP